MAWPRDLVSFLINRSAKGFENIKNMMAQVAKLIAKEVLAMFGNADGINRWPYRVMLYTVIGIFLELVLYHTMEISFFLGLLNNDDMTTLAELLDLVAVYYLWLKATYSLVFIITVARYFWETSPIWLKLFFS